VIGVNLVIRSGSIN